MILGFLFLNQTFLKFCKALSTEKYRRHINIYYYYYYYYYIYNLDRRKHVLACFWTRNIFFEWIRKQLLNPAILWSEELCRSRMVSYSSRYSSKSSCNQSSRIFAALAMFLGRTSAISLLGVFEKCALNTLTRFLAINELPANKIGWRRACDTAIDIGQ